MPTPSLLTNRSASSDELSPATLEWMGRVDLPARKARGQYMTPASVRARLLDHVDLFPGMRVLDPGVGTGGFLESVLEREPTASLVGWDIDPTVAAVACTSLPSARIIVKDALASDVTESYDLVVGNPPYFQLDVSPRLRQQFSHVISGRPNVFALFFDIALRALVPGGQLAFVVPPSMNSGSYFNALREHLLGQGAIEYLEVLDDSRLFNSAQTSVQLIVLRKGARSENYVFRRLESDGFRRTIFTSDPTALSREFVGRHSLHELGFEVATGTVLWNRVRNQLTDRPTRHTTPLIWAHHIRNGRLVQEHHPKRPRYLRDASAIVGPAIVTNRVVGAVGHGTLRAAIVPKGQAFVAENHVNVITRRPGTSSLPLESIINSLNDPALTRHIRLLAGNTQISASELCHLLPV